MHVVAGVLRNAAGRVLLTQRPPGKHLAGLWEFPGGKCEPGEAPADALRRELHEELGIIAGALEKLIAVPWHYAEKSILLDVYTVRAFSGTAHGREGQALRWVEARELGAVEMPPADRPVATAAVLPQHYVISPEPGEDQQRFLLQLEQIAGNGETLVQLRAKGLTPQSLRTLAASARDAVGKGCLLLNGHRDLVLELGLSGMHLSAEDLLDCTSRPLPSGFMVAASCHDATELAHAAAIGADFVVLGPVAATASHPGAAVLGWQLFADLCASAQLPVYALGGMHHADLDTSRAAGAQGIAGISAFWPSAPR
jgi:8-oxo-dGTP diphosphatase